MWRFGLRLAEGLAWAQFLRGWRAYSSHDAQILLDTNCGISERIHTMKPDSTVRPATAPRVSRGTSATACTTCKHAPTHHEPRRVDDVTFAAHDAALGAQIDAHRLAVILARLAKAHRDIAAHVAARDRA